MRYVTRPLAVAFALLAGACSGDAGGGPGAAKQSAQQTNPSGEVVPDQASTPKAPRAADVPGAPKADSTGSAKSAGPVSTAAPQRRTAGYVRDDFDHKAQIPEGAVPVVTGQVAKGGEWRFYAWGADKGQNCIHWFLRSEGATGTYPHCNWKGPLDRSGSFSADGRFIFGVVTDQARTVRVEHSGGVETLEAVAVEGYTLRYWAGELGPTPLTRIVALDAKGKVVAEDRNVASFNMAANAVSP